MNNKTKSICLALLLFFPFLTLAFSNHCEGECPIGDTTNIAVDHDVFAASINRNTKFADWVAYTVQSDYFVNGPSRHRYWKHDADIPDAYRLEPYCMQRRSDTTCDDYRNAHATYGYERGHLAPLASFKAHPNWKQANYYSNIVPQLRVLNNGAWKSLEAKVRDLAQQGYIVKVLAGSYYDGALMHDLPEADESHTVPTGYWKVITIEYQHELYVAAFSFEQNDGAKKLCEYEDSLAEVERRSGLDIFPNEQRPIFSLLPDLGC